MRVERLLGRGGSSCRSTGVDEMGFMYGVAVDTLGDLFRTIVERLSWCVPFTVVIDIGAIVMS